MTNHPIDAAITALETEATQLEARAATARHIVEQLRAHEGLSVPTGTLKKPAASVSNGRKRGRPKGDATATDEKREKARLAMRKRRAAIKQQVAMPPIPAPAGQPEAPDGWYWENGVLTSRALCRTREPIP